MQSDAETLMETELKIISALKIMTKAITSVFISAFDYANENVCDPSESNKFAST